MHKHFADWYSVVSPAPLTATLNARWAAVEALVSKTNSTKSAVQLVCTALSEQSNDALPAAIQDSLKAGDASLPLQNRREIAVLCASALVAGIENQKSSPWTVAAYAVELSSVAGHHSSVEALYDVAQKRVVSEADGVRTPVKSAPKGVAVTARDYSAILNVENIAATAVAIVAALKAIDEEVAAAVGAINVERVRGDFLSSLLTEQSDLLWFLLDSSYRSPRKADVPGTFSIGKSLADSLRFFPPPNNMHRFVELALRPDADKTTAIEPFKGDDQAKLPALPNIDGIEKVFPLVAKLSGKETVVSFPAQQTLLWIGLQAVKEIAGIGLVSGS